MDRDTSVKYAIIGSDVVCRLAGAKPHLSRCLVNI